MRRAWMIAVLAGLLVMIALPPLAAQAAVTAEAIGQANLRATTDVNAERVGEITTGIRYPVIGRSEFFPWLLLGDPTTNQPIGWVFRELVNINGDLNTVPFSTLIVDPDAQPTPTFTAPPPAAATATFPPVVGVAVPTATPEAPEPVASSGVVGIVSGEVNVRFGPGIDYPRIGVAVAGQRYEIVAWHTQLPWLQIRFADGPTGLGWIARDLLEIEGDVFSLPSISQVRFNLPTLTPTPPVIQSSTLGDAPPVPLSPEFAALGEEIWNMVLTGGFDPATSRFGALFLMDLQTGENITFGSEFAFSGTSINKIAILERLYASLNAPPDARLAADIANTMICSENVATNRLLSVIGDGDTWVGASRVTDFMRQLGLNRTFLTAPYTIPGQTPQPPTIPIELPTTDADQRKANADLSNQLTVDEMGWMLATMYQCAYGDGGPLMTLFPNQYEARECRQMIHVMTNNTVDALLKAGVPEDIPVAHKHGWINDTHGNAALFRTPGGDYIIVMMLHNPTWLDFSESLPLIAEVSRVVYNRYNPDTPLAEIRDGFIPETATCNYMGHPLIDDLTTFNFDG